MTQRISPPKTLAYFGMCDASAAVPLDQHHFLVADDEDNVLRAYDVKGGAPIGSIDLSAALELHREGTTRWPETDLEAGAVVGDKALWISSHSRSANGTLKLERLRMFATTLSTTPVITGRVYASFLEDVIAEPKLAKYGLRAAAEKSPKAIGGFNIEGMIGTPEGGVLIGLRNPVPHGLAIVVPIENPIAMLVHNERPRFGEAKELDLGGRGVRALSSWRGRYLIAAGSATDSLALMPQIYTWDGKGAPILVVPDVGGINPEAFYSPDEHDEVLVLSDDGTQLVGNERCKDLADATKKWFRGSWMSVGN